MIDWHTILVALFKGVHIAALMLWCGGLLALPLMLSRHDPAVTPDDYRRIRSATHTTYAIIVTPAAIIAAVAGTWRRMSGSATWSYRSPRNRDGPARPGPTCR